MEKVINKKVNKLVKGQTSPQPSPNSLGEGAVLHEFMSGRNAGEVNFNVMNLLPYRLNALLPSRKVAFTLAEVLITLGIIGVVAAMTIPALITKHKTKTIEKKLAKYYTNINQAVAMSELENGPHESWDYTLSSWEFYNKYLDKYLQTIKVQKGSNGAPDDNRFVGIYFSDGTMAAMGYTTCINFFPKANATYNAACSNIEAENKIKGSKYGKDTFAFRIYRVTNCKIEPYGKPYCNNGLTDEEVMEDCKNPDSGLYCTELIRRNGWKIPENYPVKL